MRSAEQDKIKDSFLGQWASALSWPRWGDSIGICQVDAMHEMEKSRKNILTQQQLQLPRLKFCDHSEKTAPWSMADKYNIVFICMTNQ